MLMSRKGEVRERGREVETLRDKMKSPPVEESDADEQEGREREGGMEVETLREKMKSPPVEERDADEQEGREGGRDSEGEDE